MSLKAYDLVWIEWIDAEHEGAWSEPQEAAAHEMARCESVGWLVHENERRLIVCTSTHIGHDDEVTEVGNKQIIPLGMIKSRKVLRKAHVGRKQRLQVRRSRDWGCQV